MRLLIAAATQTQLDLFLHNHQLKPNNVHRIRTNRDICGLPPKDQPILLLKGFFAGTELTLISRWKNRGGECRFVSEKQLLEGTFPIHTLMKPPSLKQLQKTADDWNNTHPIGTPVTRYKLIDPLREGSDTKTTSEAWIMGGHSVMVKVEGASGGVLLESVSPITRHPALLRPDRPLHEYPIGTKAHSHTGGHWFKMSEGHQWKWNGPNGNGGIFPTPGGDACGAFIELPTT